MKMIGNSKSDALSDESGNLQKRTNEDEDPGSGSDKREKIARISSGTAVEAVG
jgi:hypothetical protein